jgi:hypothetical protein
MTATKKPCINDATFTYTGKEMSPLGLGYCATAEKVGHFMKGKDGTMWMVGMKNGVKVWNRVPNELANEVNAPLQKDEPILHEEAHEDEAGPSVPVEAPKKKAAPKKKTPEPTEVVAKKKAAPKKKEVAEEPVEVTQEEPVAPKPKKKAAPKKKAVAEEPVAVVEEPVEVAEAPAAAVEEEPVAPKPKKKAAAKKKAVVEEAVEEVVVAVEEAVAAVEEPAPKPKKKAAPRKKSVTPKPESEVGDEEDATSVGKKEKKTRKPTDFNLFMKYRMMHMSKDIKHQEKFKLAANEWKELDVDAKKEIMEKVHIELDM